MLTPRRLASCVIALCLVLAAGCERNEIGGDNTQVSGTVTSGAGTSAVAIGGATVTVYQTQQGSTAVQGTALADDSGKFTVKYPPNSNGGILYAIARKGTNIELATLIGTEAGAGIVINELTTIATAYASNQYLQSGVIAGKPLPLQIVAGMAENLVGARTGEPSALIRVSPNADETNAYRLLGTLGNILANCVRNGSGACTALYALAPAAGGTAPTTTLQAILNIARNPNANVPQLFARGELLRAYQPYLTAQQGPNATDVAQQLDGYTLAVKVNRTGSSGCPFGGPGNIAFDKNGYAWITNNVVQGSPNSATCMIVLKPDGQPANGASGTPISPVVGGGIVGQGFGVAVDPSGSIWAGNFGWGNVIPPGGVSQLNATGGAISPASGYTAGTFRVQGVAADPSGNIWSASWGNNSLVVFPKGNAGSNLPPYTDGNTRPFDVAIADDGSAWVSYQASSTLSKFTLGSSAVVKQLSVSVGSNAEPKGIALDSKGNAWVAAGGTNLVYAYAPNGQAFGSWSGGGMDVPWSVTVDPKDNVWVANFSGANGSRKYGVTVLCGVSVANCPSGSKVGDPITTAPGYTLPSAGSEVLLADGTPLYGAGNPPSYKPLMRATAVRIDMAGNAWVANNWKPDALNDAAGNPGGDGIVIFVGVAPPVLAPQIGQPKSP